VFCPFDAFGFALKMVVLCIVRFKPVPDDLSNPIDHADKAEMAAVPLVPSTQPQPPSQAFYSWPSFDARYAPAAAARNTS
jgi:hypothetical protein